MTDTGISQQKLWNMLDWYQDVEDGTWPYSDAFLEKMKNVGMYAEIWKERQAEKKRSRRR